MTQPSDDLVTESIVATQNLSVSSKVMLAEVSISFPMTPHKGASLIAAALHETAAAKFAIPVTLCPMNDCM